MVCLSGVCLRIFLAGSHAAPAEQFLGILWGKQDMLVIIIMMTVIMIMMVVMVLMIT